MCPVQLCCHSKRPIRAILPQIGRTAAKINKSDEYYKALKSRQETYIKNNYICKDSKFFSAGSTVTVWRENRGMWMQKVIIEGNSVNHCG